LWKYNDNGGIEYATEPPTHLTIPLIREKFETHGTVCEMHK